VLVLEFNGGKLFYSRLPSLSSPPPSPGALNDFARTEAHKTGVEKARWKPNRMHLCAPCRRNEDEAKRSERDFPELTRRGIKTCGAFERVMKMIQY
jgi:hypothetical protein